MGSVHRRHTGAVFPRRSKSGDKRLKFFEIADRDGDYVPAEAWIEGDTVVVHSKAVAKPVYVRYLFKKPEPDPEVSLVNAAGLPAASFMTDDFEPEHRQLDIAQEAMRDWSEEELAPIREKRARLEERRQRKK